VTLDRTEIEAWYRGFQERFAAAIEELDGVGRFGRDTWERPAGGGGLTRILSGQGSIEKAACSFSAVWGPTPERLSERLAAASSEFYATGVSIIVHPANPFAPTFHANVRYFETDGGEAWFGGGADLTPHYFFEQDAVHFHSVIARVCGEHGVARYREWKRACDDYFTNHHRGERRGVGGVFFDHLREDLDAVWAFQRAFADVLTEAYVPILERRVHTPFGSTHRRWQTIRRGRYAEFNLVWDRGTRFGLETRGRTESILASLPPVAAWEYRHEPEPGSPEAALLDVLTGEPRQWVAAG
jgi:coproporphyrinogen III oxidase